MDHTALSLSRVQFGSTVAFHIIFASFTIGLAAWLTVLEALHLWTERPPYRQIFEFRLPARLCQLQIISSRVGSHRLSQTKGKLMTPSTVVATPPPGFLAHAARAGASEVTPT